MASVLLVEDEAGIAESLAYLLTRDAFQVTAVASLADARRQLTLARPSLVVLDVGLPDGNGLDLLRELRDATPVIVLTSRAEELDRVVGLELGADDYVTKPFSARELVARIKTVLRRAGPRPTTAPNGWSVDLERRVFRCDGVVLALTKVEFDLLHVLVEGHGRVLTREALLDRLWRDSTVTDRTIDVHVRALRKKLADAGLDPDAIETVRGLGYRARA